MSRLTITKSTQFIILILILTAKSSLSDSVGIGYGDKEMQYYNLSESISYEEFNLQLSSLTENQITIDDFSKESDKNECVRKLKSKCESDFYIINDNLSKIKRFKEKIEEIIKDDYSIDKKFLSELKKIVYQKLDMIMYKSSEVIHSVKKMG